MGRPLFNCLHRIALISLLATLACSANSSEGKPPSPTPAESAKSDDAAKPQSKTPTSPADSEVGLERLPSSGPASTPRSGFVGADDLVTRETLQFATAEQATRYDTLEACFTRYGEDWHAYPRRRFGNFVNIEWCRGKGSHINCSGGNTRTSPGAGWASLEVLQYGREWPRVFGLSFSTGQIPADEGVGVSVTVAEGGKSVLADHMHVGFETVKAGSITGKFSLGVGSSFKVGEDSVDAPVRGTAAEVYRRLIASPESLRTEALAQIAGLGDAVEAALVADSPRKCVYGPYQGEGIPPSCTKRVPLDKAEKASVRETLQQLLQVQRAMVNEHAATMHSALLRLLPTSCWAP